MSAVETLTTMIGLVLATAGVTLAGLAVLSPDARVRERARAVLTLLIGRRR